MTDTAAYMNSAFCEYCQTVVVDGKVEAFYGSRGPRGMCQDIDACRERVEDKAIERNQEAAANAAAWAAA